MTSLLAPTFVRFGVIITADSRPVGVVVYDDRGRHAAGCRQCATCTYDRRTLADAVEWLRAHLADHGIESLSLHRPWPCPPALYGPLDGIRAALARGSRMRGAA